LKVARLKRLQVGALMSNEVIVLHSHSYVWLSDILSFVKLIKRK
jgi:hypothetical protein